MPATYTDIMTPTITIDTATGTVLDLQLRLVRTVQVRLRAASRCSAAPCPTHRRR
jgi:hypothetical protein